MQVPSLPFPQQIFIPPDNGRPSGLRANSPSPSGVVIQNTPAVQDEDVVMVEDVVEEVPRNVSDFSGPGLFQMLNEESSSRECEAITPEEIITPVREAPMDIDDTNEIDLNVMFRGGGSQSSTFSRNAKTHSSILAHSEDLEGTSLHPSEDRRVRSWLCYIEEMDRFSDNGDGVATRVCERLDRWASAPAIKHVFVGVILFDPRGTAAPKILLLGDSGAPISIMSLTTLKQRFPHIELHRKFPERSYHGVGGESSLTFAGVALIPLQIGGIQMNLTVGVIKEELPVGCDIILGNYDFVYNKVDFLIPWDSESVLYQRGPHDNFPSKISKQGKFAFSSLGWDHKRRALDASNVPIAAMGTESSELGQEGVETRLVLNKALYLDQPGQYLVEGVLEGPEAVPHSTLRFIKAPRTTILGDGLMIANRNYVIGANVVRGKVKLIKSDNSPVVIRQGTILGILDGGAVWCAPYVHEPHLELSQKLAHARKKGRAKDRDLL